MEIKQKYWITPEKTTNTVQSISDNMTEPNRRDFLKFLGFGLSYVTLASSCEIPVRKAIPYLNPPEEIIPGVSQWYANTFYDGSQYCGILVKNRDGRPIKIEGNELCKITRGGTNAIVQASLLDLYDENRNKKPTIDSKECSWDEVDKQIIEILEQIKTKQRNIRIVSSTIISPSALSVINDFVSHYPSTKLVQYDAVSCSAIRLANQMCFNQPDLFDYNFEKAEVIISFDADFLGTWISPIAFTRQYSNRRKISKEKTSMSYHVQLEPNLSLTGSNADKRIPILPSEEGKLVVCLYNEIAFMSGKEGFPLNISDIYTEEIKSIARKLWYCKSKSLVVSGSNAPSIQIIINAINLLLENYGTTLDYQNPLNLKKGNDTDILALADEIKNNKMDGLIFFNCNPVYDQPAFHGLSKELEKIPLTVSLSSVPDETSSVCKFICPDHNTYESWGDAEPKKNHFSFIQPVISPVFETRGAMESILSWSMNKISYYEYLRNHWKEKIFPLQNSISDFDQFWQKYLQEGIWVNESQTPKLPLTMVSDLKKEVVKILSQPVYLKDFEVSCYENLKTGNGSHANNPWLLELPDPISKICWDNYAAISPADAQVFELDKDDVITLSFENNSITLPVFIQPGQAEKTIGIALGYGREKAGRAGSGVGMNAYPLLHSNGITYERWSSNVILQKTDSIYKLSQTQIQSELEGRPIVKESTLEKYKNNDTAGNEDREDILKHQQTLYPDHEYNGHHWAMVIDLNACTGCSGCIISCQSENNIPVVGKTEVSRSHEMHWLRMDRYYSGDENNPAVVFQPMLCQHCDNAPCENVCPVSATNHSSEGLNQMIYNRCVGTRYCANNCPYKVRRFNWFDYTNADSINGNTQDPAGMTTDLRRMILNPDVTVRSQGVMEKCSFCVQRIQEKKLQAKLENRKLNDGDIRPACAQSCPSEAIVFGDTNDPDSKVSRLYKNKRMYHVLEELHVLPSIGYLTKIRNIS